MNGFREALRPLYPELGGRVPDPERHADSIIVRVLNAGPDALRERMLEYYGADKVRSVARSRVNRLDSSVYRAWKNRLQLPERSAAVERVHRMWRP